MSKPSGRSFRPELRGRRQAPPLGHVLIRRRPLSLRAPARRTQTPPAGDRPAAEVTKGSRADRGDRVRRDRDAAVRSRTPLPRRRSDPLWQTASFWSALAVVVSKSRNDHLRSFRIGSALGLIPAKTPARDRSASSKMGSISPFCGTNPIRVKSGAARSANFPCWPADGRPVPSLGTRVNGPKSPSSRVASNALN
jgi:hypothetical protein